MKKKVLSIAVAAMMVISVSAQEGQTPAPEAKKAKKEKAPKEVQVVPEIKSKKGENYLPEAGDWALGFDALPLINTIGKVMSDNTGSTSVTGTGGATNYISLKKFKDAKTAYRGVVGINFGSTTDKMYVVDVTSTAIPQVQLTDKEKLSSNSITLGGGLEKRRGNTRLQGYYGGMLMFILSSSKSEYTYGNALTATNTSHNNSFGQGAGVLGTKAGSTFGIMLNGLVGAEYFILPKLSIGAEYWWGVGFSSTGDGETETESWDTTTLKVVNTKTKTAGGSSFNLGGQYGSTAMAFVNLHF